MSTLIPTGSASGTGSMTLAAPVTNSNQTATLPDATGTVMVSGNMPAFFAYVSTNQTVSSNTNTKIAAASVLFDTHGFYSNTNYRFTPTIAGYYQISGGVGPYGSGIPTRAFLSIYKNGGEWIRLQDIATNNTNSPQYVDTISGSGLVYLNGSTDYVEIYGWTLVPSGTPQFQGNANPFFTFISGVLVRN